MANSHPIWNEVTACKYRSNKSFGFSDTGTVNVYVGSSASNSHDFVETCVTRRFTTIYHKGKYIDACVFQYSVDDVVLKIKVFENNNGRAGKYLYTQSKMKKLKSLKLRKRE